ERVVVIDRAGVNRHVELGQVRFSGGGKEADDVGTECRAGENPGEELDDHGEAVAFVACGRFLSAQRLQGAGERLLGSGGWRAIRSDGPADGKQLSPPRRDLDAPAW